MNNSNNNQGNNFAASASSSLFGRSATMPLPHQQQYPNLMSHQQQWAHVLSRSNPQTQFHGNFPFAESQSQPQAALQAHYAQLQAQAAYGSLQSSQAQPVTPLRSAGNTTNVGLGSTPVTGSSKRAASQRNSLRTPGSSGVSQNVLDNKSADLTPASRRRKRELLEKQVAAILPESALYTQLLDFEAQIDAALDKKKVDMQEAIRSPTHVQKTLRMYVFNTFSNRSKASSEDTTAEESSWSLKIIGRVLEDGNGPVSGISQRSSPCDTKFSDFFKKVTICLDQNLYPENHIIVWDSARSPKQQDGFEVKRKGDKEFTAVIKIDLKYSPEKFMVSAALSKLLGIEVESRPRIIASLWHYVKSRRLQCPDEPSSFICDPSLQRIFGEEKMGFSMAAQKLLDHLSPPKPIYLEHNIKLSGDCPAGTACYDVQVDVPILLQKEMSAFLASNSVESHKEIEASDEIISSNLKKIQEHRRRRAFFLSFSQSPSEFINAMIASKSKDPKHAAGDAGCNSNKEQHSEFYNQPWAEDAVIRYLNRKAAGRDAPEGN
ncbi:SWI/SNF complex component SNF12 homolog [Vicia villosa]|uniref:SWI/SNF complex component SNF12 homolog n=1 Tax=Vicia villosa TaxID=3911 RepID=UPI00273BC98C|nr:SWI/SNF complex component SNF12 homolog [Vicia villosa]